MQLSHQIPKFSHDVKLTLSQGKSQKNWLSEFKQELKAAAKEVITVRKWLQTKVSKGFPGETAKNPSLSCHMIKFRNPTAFSGY